MMKPPVEVIAEIANAHQGEPAQALELACRSAAAGADAIKFQLYQADELLVAAHPRYDHFRRQAFAPEIWFELLETVRLEGIRIYADVFGLSSLALARRAGVQGVKIHSSDLGNQPLLQMASGHEGPLLLAVGGSTAHEIGAAVDALASVSRRPVLLHGFQSYPTAVADAALERIAWLRAIFGDRCEVGYMDHVAADDPLAYTLPLAAACCGARVLEKHVTLDRAARGVDYYSSFEPAELARFIDQLRQLENAFAGRPADFSPAERRYRETVKKHWVASRPLAAGAVLQTGDLTMKRVAEYAAHPVAEHLLLGRRLLAPLAVDEPVSRLAVNVTVWALVVVRMRSRRLPGKALLPVAGRPAIGHLLERLKQIERIDRVVLCTTDDPVDDPLVQLAMQAGIGWHRGSVDDVLARMLGALAGQPVDVVLRVTGDDLLVDPDYADRAIDHHLRTNSEYTDLKALPSGTEVEVFDVELLRRLYRAAVDSDGTEYLTYYVTHHRDQILTSAAPVEEHHRREWRLTLDTAEDYEVISRLLEAMAGLGRPLTYRMDDIVDYFVNHPEVSALNAAVRQRSQPPQVCTDLDWRRF
ncbi:MAG: N-acetylneuraminate synthase family protein [Deltaproteobacteria bacterium]|nr:N-acetylneuraminate synthase family protein [Candidatus Anaeroferrophillacea bacterium]